MTDSVEQQGLQTNSGELTALRRQAEQYTAQLQIINSIQQGLAAELDFRAIVDLVGDKLTEIFPGENVAIGLYDKATGIEKVPYLFENGKRIENVEFPLGDTGLASHVAKTLKPLVINNNFDERAKEFGTVKVSDAPSPKCWLGVPIILNGEFYGGFALQNWERENAYTDSHVRLLETLAGSLGIALGNARLFSEVQERNAEITEALERETATGEILKVIASSPSDIQPVLDVIAEYSARLSGSDDAVIVLAEENFLRVSAHYGNIPITPVGEGIPLNKETVIGRAVLEHETFQTIHGQNEASSDYPAGDANAKKFGHRMTFSTPLMRQGKAIGGITIRHVEPKLLSDKQVELVKTFAAQAVIAVENVRLFNETKHLLKETEQRAAELAVINSIQQGLAAKLDIQSIIDLVGDKLGEIFEDMDVVQVNLYDRGANKILIPYCMEKGERHQHEPKEPWGIRKYVIDTGEPLVINVKAEETSQSFSNPIISGESPKSLIFVPLKVDERVRGIISLQNMQRENAFPESTVRLLTTLANSMSMALENARLFDEVQKRNQEISEALEQQTATSEVLRALSGFQPDLRALLEIIAVNAAKVCGADDAHIYRIEGDVLKEWTHHGPIPGLEKGEPFPLNRGSLTGRAIVDREIIPGLSLETTAG